MTKAVAAWLVLGFVWGSTWLFIKLGLADLPPFTFAGIRFVVAVVPLLVILRVRRIRLPRDPASWRLLAVTGLLTFTVNYGLVFWGEARIPSGLTAILFTTFPLFGQLFAHAALPSEPLRVRKLGGVGLGIAGVAVIFADQLHIEDVRALEGCAAVVLAAAGGAWASVQVKKRGAHLQPVVVTAGQMLIGLVPLLVIGVLTEGDPLALHWTPIAVISLVYLALLGSTLTFVLWYWLIRRIEVTRAQLIPLINTVVAVVLGWLVLDERLGARALAGGAAVLAGLALTLTAPSSPTAVAPSPSRAPR